MTPAAVWRIGVVNVMINTLSTMLSLWTLTSTAPQMATQSASVNDVVTSSLTLMLGLGLYTAGLSIEFVSELDRKRFKDKPENRGKPYGGGLWSWATDINYGGFMLWRAGYAVVAAGLPWGAAAGAFFFYDLSSRAAPALDNYCVEKVCLSASLFDGQVANKSTTVWGTVVGYQEACALQAPTIHLLGRMQEAWLRRR